MQFSQLCFLTTLLILHKSPSSCPESRMVNYPHERGIEITLLKVLVYLYKWDQETNHGSKSEVAAWIVSHRFRHIGCGFGETQIFETFNILKIMYDIKTHDKQKLSKNYQK